MSSSLLPSLQRPFLSNLDRTFSLPLSNGSSLAANVFGAFLLEMHQKRSALLDSQRRNAVQRRAPILQITTRCLDSRGTFLLEFSLNSNRKVPSWSQDK